MKTITLFFLLLTLVLFIFSFYIFPIMIEGIIPPQFHDLSKKTLISVIVLVVAITLSKVFDEWVRHALRRVSEMEVGIVSNIFRYTVLGIALLMIAFTFVGDVGSLSVFLGLVGAGLAVALQQPLSCVIAWLVIITNRLYRIGDRVAIDGVRGDIADIRLFFTQLVEVDEMTEQETGRLVFIPNNVIFAKNILNYTLENPFVWDEVLVSVTYESDIKLANKLIEKAAHEIVGKSMENAAYYLSLRSEPLQKFRDRTAKPITYIKFAPSSVDISVRYLVEARSRRNVHSAITSRIFEYFSKTPGVEIAYPTTRTIRIEPEAKSN
ncbi:MAG: mechanosensitive ion channel family protein [Candidatus Micrarchaeia archaeon]